MSSHIIKDYEKAMLRSEIPDFAPGDTLRVSLKIVEGDKERLQDFEGVCIRRKGSGIAETVTLRKTNYGVGIERIIPLHSPKVDAIRVVRFGKVRRAKLYYLRDLTGKAARITERKTVYTGKPKGAAKTPKQQVAETAPVAEEAKAPEAEAAPQE